VNPTGILIGLAVTFLGVTATGAQDQPKHEPFLEFAWQGGRSPYRTVQVTISAAGAARVLVAKQVGPAMNYATTLSPEELAAMRDTIQAVQFFTRPDENKAPLPDAGRTTLTVRLGEQERTVSCAHCGDLEPLTVMMWQLAAQGEAVEALARDEDIHTSTAVVNSRLAGRKALQPAQLKEPLLKYVQTHADRQRVEWALTALAFVTTAEEFGKVVAQGVDDPQQRDVLLTIVGTHPFHGNIPVEHWRALCPLYLAFARDARGRQDKLTKTEAQALSDFTRMLGETRYQPAIPVLKTWFEAHRKPYVDGSFTPLAKMGEASLTALIPYLRSDVESYRVNAIELLVIAARGGPRAGFANPLPEQEYARMIPVFREQVISRLVELAERDSSAKVQAKARTAVEEINKHVKE
jgi:hypothetical protein